MSFSIAILEGRLGKDPEIKTTGSGSKYCKFSVAVERSYKNGDERITDWIDCTCWNAACDLVPFVKPSSISTALLVIPLLYSLGCPPCLRK